MIHPETFLRDYNFFWSLAPVERPSVDGSLVALIFVMLAMGTQFVTLPSSDDKEQTAEFYGKTPGQAHEDRSDTNLMDKFRHHTKRSKSSPTSVIPPFR